MDPVDRDRRHPAPPDPAANPKRSVKVERYQQTLAREWAYGQRYRTSDARAAAVPIWLAQTGHPSPASETTRGTNT